MYNEKMHALGSHRSVIREIFEYSKKRAAEIGEENVFDFSLGNPSVEPPHAVTEALKSGRTINKVYLADGDTDKSLGRLAAMAKDAGAVVVRIDRRKLNDMSPTGAHQGIIAAVAALILAVILLMGGGETSTTETAAPSVSGNDGRVQFLKSFGWDVTTSPTESSQVRIPQETTEVFDRYNSLQKGQGYDLSTYAGKNVMRYVYQINNYPGATQPVYATLLVHKGQVIGGDVSTGKVGDTAFGSFETHFFTLRTSVIEPRME